MGESISFRNKYIYIYILKRREQGGSHTATKKKAIFLQVSCKCWPIKSRTTNDECQPIHSVCGKSHEQYSVQWLLTMTLEAFGIRIWWQKRHPSMQRVYKLFLCGPSLSLSLRVPVSAPKIHSQMSLDAFRSSVLNRTTK